MLLGTFWVFWMESIVSRICQMQIVMEMGANPVHNVCISNKPPIKVDKKLFRFKVLFIYFWKESFVSLWKKRQFSKRTGRKKGAYFLSFNLCDLKSFKLDLRQIDFEFGSKYEFILMTLLLVLDHNILFFWSCIWVLIDLWLNEIISVFGRLSELEFIIDFKK